MISIVFICSGNICRSPMAHYYMRKRLCDLGVENKYCITSCGTEANTGERATKYALYTISQYGVDMSKHRATNIKDANIENADYIICMTKMHYNFITGQYPNLVDKVYILKEMILNKEEYIDIDDPWGLDLQVYSGCAKEITDAVDKLIIKIESGEKV